LKTFVIESLGCRASQADGAAIAASLRSCGFSPASGPGAVDLVVVNTCTVTQGADADARRLIRGLHRDHPDARIVVTGCYAQRAPEELAQIQGVTWVVGNGRKDGIAALVQLESAPSEFDYHGQIAISDMSQARVFQPMAAEDTTADRTRPNLKIQDGCGNRCSFCIIPSIRGRSRSASPDDVVEQVATLSRRYNEIVLSGINMGRWGRDLASGMRFAGLLRRILDETPVRRLRLSSVEPMDWSDDLLDLLSAEDRMARHIHMPLQSGSDAVLKRMFRKYRVRHYADRLQKAWRAMPDAALGADVMTGFPGETDEEFGETVRFIEEQPFTYLHVFTYSERSGTAAATMSGAVPVSVRKERTGILRELSFRKNRAFRERMIGRRLPAVTLEERGRALTTNFLNVELSQIREPNVMLDLEIGGLTNSGLLERSLFPIVS
jgi:threonylcarbamoyladenosine tRNA methylthiotransferase MtaB